MSQVFSSGQDPKAEVLTPQEVEALIRDHDAVKTLNDGRVTIGDMAETLGLPASEIQQRVLHMRARPNMGAHLGEAPMSSGAWLRKRLWVWVMVSFLVLWMSGTLVKALGKVPRFSGPPTIPKISFTGPNYKDTDGIYKHEKIVKGRSLKLESIPGFSYELMFGGIDAAVNGDSKSYVPADELSEESLKVIQEQFAQKMLEGLDKAVASSPPEWTNNQAVAVVKPNYYPGGDPVPIDLTLEKGQFPYKADSPEGKALHDKLLSELHDQWSDIIDN